MRNVLCALLAFVLMTTGHVFADDQAELKTLATAVIKAAGGEEKLATLHAVEWKSKGTINFNGKNGDLVLNGTAQAFDQYYLDVVGTANGQSQDILFVVNGDKGWLHSGKDTIEAPKDFVTIIKGSFHAVRLAQMLPLNDKAYELAAFGETKIGERTAVGIRVSRKDQQDVTLFFDKETHLLLKGETRSKEGDNGQEVGYEFFCSDHKEFDGVKHFTKLTFKRDGVEFLAIELSELTPKTKVDDAVFAKP